MLAESIEQELTARVIAVSLPSTAVAKVVQLVVATTWSVITGPFLTTVITEHELVTLKLRVSLAEDVVSEVKRHCVVVFKSLNVVRLLVVVVREQAVSV